MKKLTFLLLCVAMAACGGPARQPEAQPAQEIPTTLSMKGETIKLTTPTSTATLLDALKERKSVRSYDDSPLTIDQLSGVLWAAAGQTRPDGKLTAPSAMALYPIKVYAVIETGIYLYNSAKHELTLVKAGDYRKLTGLQDFVSLAALNIMYIADLSVYEGKGVPELNMLLMCAMDAMGYCENANLWAAGNGMDAITRAGAHGEEFLAEIGAPASYRFMLAQSVGTVLMK
ncbi:MAG: SagB/ThcOx family dehydrogenase [Rikenellaceae bacterium]|jgi:nitroreductase|nr:SagB/ThcOx family dehydrogenase [Rikenellaceae bacterium]